MSRFSNDPFQTLAEVPAFTLMSNDIAEGEVLRGPQLSGRMQVPDGQDISPHLSWTGFPAETKSFAVTMFDPDAPTQSGWWHWAVANVPGDVVELPSDAGNPDRDVLPVGALALRNDAGFAGFLGAAPPPGHGPHRYFFVVQALDVDELEVDADSSPAMLGFTAFPHCIARAHIECTFELKG